MNQSDIDRVKAAEASVSLLHLVNEWLGRMPFLKDSAYWTDEDDFFRQYRNVYEQSLQQGEEQNLGTFDALFFTRSDGNNRRLSRDANRAALFIMLFRDYPLLPPPTSLSTACWKSMNSLLNGVTGVLIWCSA